MSVYSIERYYRRSRMTEEEHREYEEEKGELKSWEQIEAEAIGEDY